MRRWTVALGRNLAAVAALAALAQALAVPAGHAQTKPLQKVGIAAATPALNITYPQLTLPLTLGYWKDEGYEVNVQPAGGSLQTIQQLVGGNATFAAGSANTIVSANAKSNLPVRIVVDYAISDWSLAVLDDGPIKSAKDIKGKTVGVFNLATGGIAYLNGLLRNNGMDPAKDIEVVALGLGAPPVDALRSGKVQGVVYWSSAVASFENAGLKLRKIVGDDWKSHTDYALSTLQATADKDPAMVIGIARGSMKGLVFALANPLCALKLHWAKYPSTKPTGADEDTLVKWDLHILEAQLAPMAEAFPVNGGQYWGNVDPAALNKLVAFMVESKQIDKAVPAKDMMLNIPDLYAKVSAFDVKAVQDSAKACKF